MNNIPVDWVDFLGTPSTRPRWIEPEGMNPSELLAWYRACSSRLQKRHSARITELIQVYVPWHIERCLARDIDPLRDILGPLPEEK